MSVTSDGPNLKQSQKLDWAQQHQHHLPDARNLLKSTFESSSLTLFPNWLLQIQTR